MNETHADDVAVNSGWMIGPWIPGVLATRLCVWIIDTTRSPVFKDAFMPLTFAQAQMRRGAAVINCLRGADPGDGQAVRAYQGGLAVGFYGLERTYVPASTIPVPGSVWQQNQLSRLRDIGLRHGALTRHLCPDL